MRRVIAFLVLAGVTLAAGSGVDDPRPAAAVPPPAVPTVAFVGDSIGRDAEPEVRAAVQATNPVSYYHAIGAGYIRYHLPLLRPVVAAPGGPDIVVAELGTGDAFWSASPRRFENDMRRFLDVVTPHVSCVVWIDQKPGGNRAYPMINRLAATYNRIVHRVVRDYPEATYLHYAAWTALAGSPSPYFLADYLHLTDAGERELARLVASGVRGCDPATSSGPFWDVADTHWAADEINWAAAEGIVGGYDNDSYRARVGRFQPPVTRGQAVRMAWRLVGAPNEPRAHGWSDGTPSIAAALRWAWWSGAVPRLPHGAGATYEPDEAVTRGELIHLLWRTAGAVAPYPPHGFSDPVPAHLRAAVRWAVAEGIVRAGAGPFRPDGPVDRARIAVWLQATDAFLHAPPAPPPPPVPAPGPTVPSSEPPPTTASPTTVIPTTLPPGSTPTTTLVP